MKYLITLAAAFALTSSVYAADNIGIGGDIGTTGVGAHLTFPVAKDLNGRIGFGYGTYSYNGTTSDVNYDFKLKANIFDALLDWYPMSNGFRVTGGLVYNNTRIDAVGKPTASGTYVVDGTTYTSASAGNINGRIDFRKAAPYIGLGFGNALTKTASGWSFGGDFGVIYAGSPKTVLTNSGCTAPAGTCAQLATDLTAENARLSDKVNNYKVYPVVRFGVNYRF